MSSEKALGEGWLLNDFKREAEFLSNGFLNFAFLQVLRWHSHLVHRTMLTYT